MAPVHAVAVPIAVVVVAAVAVAVACKETFSQSVFVHGHHLSYSKGIKLHSPWADLQVNF